MLEKHVDLCYIEFILENINHFVIFCDFSTLMWQTQSKYVPLKYNDPPVCIVSIMAADGLVMWGARASTAMILIQFNQIILIPAPEELTHA